MGEKFATSFTMQWVNGEFVPAQEVCLVHAEGTFQRRCKEDTNPRVVQMILRGEKIPHFYYRSEEWVDQPYYDPRAFITPYVGPAKLATPGLYDSGTYVVDREMTEMLRRRYCK